MGHPGDRTLGLIANLGDQTMRGLTTGFQMSQQRQKQKLMEQQFQAELEQFERNLPIEQQRAGAAMLNATTNRDKFLDRPNERQHDVTMAGHKLGRVAGSKAKTPEGVFGSANAVIANDPEKLGSVAEADRRAGIEYAENRERATRGVKQEMPTPTARDKNDWYVVEDRLIKQLERAEKEKRTILRNPKMRGPRGEPALQEIDNVIGRLTQALTDHRRTSPRGGNPLPSQTRTSSSAQAIPAQAEDAVQKAFALISQGKKREALALLKQAGWTKEQLAAYLNSVAKGE